MTSIVPNGRHRPVPQHEDAFSIEGASSDDGYFDDDNDSSDDGDNNNSNDEGSEPKVRLNGATDSGGNQGANGNNGSSSNHDDEDEIQSLVSPAPIRRQRRDHFHDEPGATDGDDYIYNDDDYYEGSNPIRSLGIAMIVILIVATLALLIPTRLPGLRRRRRDRRRRHRLPVAYSCSKSVQIADNYIEETFTHDYVNVSKHITNNVTEWLQTFRDENFDNWGHSYEYVKKAMRPFKAKYFPSNIKNGGSIYESACGVGLNLYMTLEILKEEKDFESLWVYGNEYVPESVDKARMLFDEAPPAHAKRGMMCQGDSTQLDFVPSNAFDLVYTGYISPLYDPLRLEYDQVNSNYRHYTSLCREASKADDEDEEDGDNDGSNANEAHWQAIKLRDIAQQTQNDWYGQWVSEMVRIAKPGVAVIIEQVSQEFCDAQFDWGGVSQGWWTSAIDTYDWDIDPTSLEFTNDTIFRDRYHVFMRKNGITRVHPGE